jgi:hypothetical protein
MNPQLAITCKPSCIRLIVHLLNVSAAAQLRCDKVQGAMQQTS